MIVVTTARTREAIAMMPDFVPSPYAKRHTTRGAHRIFCVDDAPVGAAVLFSPDVARRTFHAMSAAVAWIARDGGEAVS